MLQVNQLRKAYGTQLLFDGVTFAEEYTLNLEGAGPFVLRRSSGRYLLYYDGYDEALGHHVRVAEVELDP